MESYLNDLIGNEDWASTTKKGRIGFLLSAWKSAGEKENDLSFLKHRKAVMSRVNDSDNVRTRFNRLVHIKTAIELTTGIVDQKTIDVYTKELDRIHPEKVIANDDNKFTETQLKIFMTIAQLNKVVESALIKVFSDFDIEQRGITTADLTRLAKLPKRNPLYVFRFAKQLQDVVLMACYVWQPALRNNWADMHFVSRKAATRDQSINYWFGGKGSAKIILNDYKNVYSMGKNREIVIPDKLYSLMFHWNKVLTFLLCDNPEYPLLYSITNDSITHIENKATTQRAIPRVFKKYTDKDIGINDLRHSWEKQIQSAEGYDRMTINQKTKLHEELLHNYNTAMRYNLVY